jgi:hypothetical protein
MAYLCWQGAALACVANPGQLCVIHQLQSCAQSVECVIQLRHQQLS